MGGEEPPSKEEGVEGVVRWGGKQEETQKEVACWMGEKRGVAEAWKEARGGGRGRAAGGKGGERGGRREANRRRGGARLKGGNGVERGPL